MIEWMVQWHFQMVFNHAFIQGLMPYCDAANLWRFFAFGSLAIWLIRWFLAAFSQRRLLQQLQLSPPPDASTLAIYRHEARRLGLKKAPPLYVGFQKHAAFAGGFFKRYVFVNQSLLNQLSDDELGALFSHELVHIQRRDHFKLALVEGLLFATPFWMMQFFLHQVGCQPQDLQILAFLSFMTVILGWRYGLGIYRNKRELSCDDQAVKATAKPLALASALLKTWRWLKQATPQSPTLSLIPATFAVGPNMEKRIRRLLTYRKPFYQPWLSQCLRTSFVFACFYIGWFLYDFHIKKPYAQVINHCASKMAAKPCPSQPLSVIKCHPDPTGSSHPCNK